MRKTQDQIWNEIALRLERKIGQLRKKMAEDAEWEDKLRRAYNWTVSVLNDMSAAARAAVCHLEACQKGRIRHPYKSASLPLLKAALKRIDDCAKTGKKV